MKLNTVLKCLAGMLILAFVHLDAIAQRYAPGCLREQLYMEQALARLASGQVVGLEIIRPEQIGDPRFNDGNWSKYAEGVIDRFPVGSPQDPVRMIRRFKMEIHYMRNLATGEIADFKFTNSVQEGCDGYEQPALAPGGDDLAAGDYSMPQGLGTNWFAQPTWPEAIGTVTVGDIIIVQVAPIDTGGGSGCREPYCGALTLL